MRHITGVAQVKKECGHGIVISGWTRCPDCERATEEWDRTRPAPPPMKIKIIDGPHRITTTAEPDDIQEVKR